MYDIDKYVIKIYFDGNFYGYVKTIIKSASSIKFIKTKNIDKAIYYITIVDCDIDKTYLDLSFNGSIFNGENYTFEISKISIKDIRNLKLKKLKKTKKDE